MKLSVIMPSNKSSENIIRALDSLNFENTDDIEYLINLDKVDKKIEQLIADKKYPNLKIYNDSGSLADILNLLIERSQGEYIARADDDDIYIPNRLAIQLNYLQARKDIDVVGAGMYLFQENNIIGLKLYPPTHDQICIASLFECHTFAHPVVMGRRGFFIDLKYRNVDAEDFDLWVRGICCGYKYSNLEIPLLIYSMPNYSKNRKEEMEKSVNRSITQLLNLYFNVEIEKTDHFLSILSERSRTAESLTTFKKEDLNYLLMKIMSKGLGKNDFFETVRRYADALYLKLANI